MVELLVAERCQVMLLDGWNHEQTGDRLFLPHFCDTMLSWRLVLPGAIDGAGQQSRPFGAAVIFAGVDYARSPSLEPHIAC